MPGSLGQEALVRKLSCFMQLTQEEITCLTQLQARPRSISGPADLVHEGDRGQSAYVLDSGWAYSYKLLPDGGRQVITFSLPGDFLGLRSILLRTSDHSFSAITDVAVTPLSVERLRNVFNDFPRLGNAVLWSISRDEATVVEHLVSIGRRSAIERIAHLILELRTRLKLVGLVSDGAFEFPVNQYLMADALGLSSIHVNRVLRQLRERGLLSIKAHRVLIHDLEALVELAGYEDEFLDQEAPSIFGEDRR